MEATKQNDSTQLTPEQLLKLLELQSQRERAKREKKTRNRATFLAAGILVIIGAAGLALMIAQQLLVDLHDRTLTGPPPAEMELGR